MLNGRVGLGAVLALLGIAGIVGLFACNESVEGFLGDRCQRGSVETDPNGNRARAWRCRDTPSRLASALAEAHTPADRRSTPEGHFLRYRNTMVGIFPEGRGSKAYTADERAGYGFFLPFVGGWWGTGGGAGERFRGGGPAGGK